ncbi:MULTISPECIES: terpene synthase family protein [unclassified Roseofilum]|uniref:terpene synthase family protein n=1 Tax=unclassified Roseofilum TaxID=2620099 RepID=UPI000E8F2252|nr:MULTISPECIES: terpene synthase family protein [unclassified Roseofilum]MBP0009865.1 hypothetical protein [Roseofilum sp. Belize Diploria]MBP0034309.1 hypothetical protein [Roseofilum sp. Belize BBD 4]HBQ98074.1 hypothetical protein [Cyanobacteria bacterium UBA11691]
MKLTQSSTLKIATTDCKLHPKATAILTKAKNHCKLLGIYDEDRYLSHHTMTPYLFGYSSFDRTVDATIFFSVLYYLDDFFGEDSADSLKLDAQVLFRIWQTGKYHIMNRYPPSKIDRLCAALAYISGIIQTKSPYSFFQHYTNYLRLHLQHSLYPINYQTVEEYIQTRIHFGGMYPTIGMIEYVYDTYLTEELRDSLPLLVQLEESCALIGALSNDLFSYHKEAHSRFNLLNALMETHANCNLEKAIKLAVDRVNGLYDNFLLNYSALKIQAESLPIAEQQIITTYVDSLQQLIAASYHWQLNTNRYRAHDNVFEDMRIPLTYSILK